MTNFDSIADAAAWGVYANDMTPRIGFVTRRIAEAYAEEHGGFVYPMRMIGPHEAHWYRSISAEAREELSPDVATWQRANDVYGANARRKQQKWGGLRK